MANAAWCVEIVLRSGTRHSYEAVNVPDVVQHAGCERMVGFRTATEHVKLYLGAHDTLIVRRSADMLTEVARLQAQCATLASANAAHEALRAGYFKRMVDAEARLTAPVVVDPTPRAWEVRMKDGSAVAVRIQKWLAEQDLADADSYVANRPHTLHPLYAAVPLPAPTTEPGRCPNCGSKRIAPTSGNAVGNTMDCLLCGTDFTPAAPTTEGTDHG